MPNKGLFIAIEGGDGSGKGTQADLLKTFFESIGKNVKKISFPQYGRFSANFAETYLNSGYGESVNPELASLTYAVDRFAAKDEILQFLNSPNNILIADRYVASNLAHQGGKIQKESARHDFYKKIEELEFGLLGLPRPNKNIVLLVDTKMAQKNVDKKEKRNYTDKKRDLHEDDPNHLEHAKKCFEELCKIDPKNYIAIKCMKSGKMRSIEDIHENIKNIIGIT